MGRLRTLQKKILIALKKRSYPTITSLATSLKHQRPAVSISLRKLIEAGLVSKNRRVIELSPAGLEVAKDAKVYQPLRGSFAWIDDECAGWKCPCVKFS